MAYLRHDSGGPAELNNGQVLGDDSPLQFDADGYAGPIDDEDARVIQAMHTHVEAVPNRPEADTTEDAAETQGDSSAHEGDSPQDAESGPSAEGDDDTAHRTNEDGEPLCAGTTGGGDPCTRTVDEPGGYCYQHGPED